MENCNECAGCKRGSGCLVVLAQLKREERDKIGIIKEEFESINMEVLEDYPKKMLSDFIKRIHKTIIN